ncbi:XrtA system polysaccharide chain length determinant [Alkalilimnicola sp. S0819]|uniref:XrtA system polysaccharide chain length determinant n=1 Tax=Alkalilimnicola sp. S0819 TaxID=2613922 RepID=UPI00126231B0|nr:XrtA system polysaccharide chain length determinant [Alkalilimnicola sp. S0819]KAB7622842.1 hypothetical protein F3N43_11005 [Alkalilimnicola sp. S0819]MPQ17164.1 hypothetical protein [Alkalilimnicola sp. S0819]
MRTDLEHELDLLLREANARRRWVLGGYLLVIALVLAVGWAWPKSYQTSTSLYVDNQNIIGQLMEGAAVRTTVADSADSARSIILGHQNLAWVLEQGGWLASSPSPAEQEQLMASIRQRTRISNEGENILRISYRDSDPQRALRTTRLLADVFVREVREAKHEESKAAYTFIDRQASQYEQQLADNEARLKRLGVDPEMALEPDFAQRANALRERVASLRQELRSAEITQTTVREQLARYPRRAEGNAELRQLQAQLAQLRTQYHEAYPDIIAVQEQIGELRRQAVGGDSTDPVYQELRRNLFEVNTRIKTLGDRLGAAELELESAAGLGSRSADAEELEQLVRDYRMGQEIYADLRRRREAARVSMKLDSEQQGLTLRVNQPAYLPHQAEGPRLLHFALAGLLLGVALPLGSVYALARIDPRVRRPEFLNEELGLPVLAVVPPLRTAAERRADARALVYAGLVLLSGVMLVVVVLLLRAFGGE